MTAINALVLTGYGLNCDMETAHALSLAGATPTGRRSSASCAGSGR